LKKPSSRVSSIAVVVVALSSFTGRARAEAPTDRPPTDAHEGDEEEGLRIGPLAGVGFPRPLELEGLVKIDGVLALGVEYSALPKTTIDGVESSMWALAGDLRVFPFKGAFFVGARAGHQSLSASTTLSASSVSLTETATADAWFVNPRIGFLWTWRSGVTLGIDAGVELPIGAKLATSLPAGAPSQLGSTVSTVAGVLGNDVTPTIDLIRLGYLF
jgi:hypothetical protein